MDVIIRNQDIQELETTCFGLTLAIFRFHLEKANRKNCYTYLTKHVGDECSTPTRVCINCVTNLTISFFKMKPEDGQC